MMTYEPKIEGRLLQNLCPSGIRGVYVLLVLRAAWQRKHETLSHCLLIWEVHKVYLK
jgi:hypothetical protein